MTALTRGEVVGTEVPAVYHDLVRPHIESFDYFLGDGMCKAIDELEPVRVRTPSLLLRFHFLRSKVHSKAIFLRYQFICPRWLPNLAFERVAKYQHLGCIV